MASIVVDTVDLIRDLVTYIEDLPEKPVIFIDLEGVNLSRDGVIAIMQVLVPPNPEVHLVDVHTLQKDAFSTPGPAGGTLKTILESELYPKVFFDVRNDSDALYSHFDVGLRGVIDLQLLEVAVRSGRGRFVKGLAKCISEDGNLGWTKSQEWQRTKEEGQRLFAPEKGGKYEVFLERPLSLALQKYCAQDVLVMPELLKTYARRIRPQVATQISKEALARVALSQSPNYNGKGRHMAVAPSFTLYGSSGTTTLDFPMSLVCSDQLAARCSFSEVVAPVTQVVEQGSSSRPSGPEGLTIPESIGEVTNALRGMGLIGTHGEATDSLQKLEE